MRAGAAATPSQLGALALVKRSIRYLSPYAGLAVPLSLTYVVEIAFWTIYPLGVRALIDNATFERDSRSLALTLAFMVACFLVTIVAMIAQGRLGAAIGAHLLGDLRVRLVDRLQELPSDFYQRAQVGDLIARFSTDTATIEAAVVGAFPRVVYHATRIVILLAVLVYLSWQLALVALAVLPLAAIGPRLVSPRAAETTYRRRESEGGLAAFVQEIVAGHQVIRAFGLRPVMLDRFRVKIASFERLIQAEGFLSRLVRTSTVIGATLGQLAVIAVGGLLVFGGLMSVGSLVGFIGVLLTIGGSAETLSVVLTEFLPLSAAQRRLDELFEVPLSIVERGDARSAPRLRDQIELRGVTFGYDPAAPIARELDLILPARRYVALVGPSGSGKSTVLGLVQRLYDPQEGAVLVDGLDLREIGLASLRQQIGVVFQDTFLFSGTVRENIRLGRTGATDQEIEVAARAAQVHDAIARLPGGYDTDVGERGGRLSGGQRQRIALARAILRDPAILVLDEATSALDPATEAAFNEVLHDLADGRTILSVTHRLAGVVRADLIVVLCDGHVVEQGTHAELLARGALYHELWQQQQGFVVSEDGQRATIEAARLGEIPLLRGVDGPSLALLASLLVSETYRAGEEIIREGEIGDKFYVLARGSVEAVKATPEGEQPLRRMNDGAFFGEVALLADVPRTATVRARTNTLVLALAREHFERLLAASPAVREAVEAAARERGGLALA